MERDQHDKGNEAPEDAKEDLELTDEDADGVRGGVVRDDIPLEFLKIDPDR